MTQPQKKAPHTTQKKSAAVEPVCAGQPDEAHEQQAQDYNQPNGMTCKKTRTIAPEWNDFRRINFGFASNGFARVPARNSAGSIHWLYDTR